jgi:ABC-2 type transport system permease protein
MNIFKREWKAYRKSLIFWSIGMLFMVAAGMGKFTAYSGAGQSMNQLLTSMPKTLQAVFGMTGLDLTKASGFYGVLLLYLLLMATIHAALTGAGIIAKEEEEKTAEFLFVKPVSRVRVITAKLLAALVSIIVLNLVTLGCSLAIVGKYSNGEAVNGVILKLMLGMLILQLIFMALGAGIAAISKNPRIAGSAATGVLLLTYLLSVMVDLNSKLDKLRYLTPFKYFDAQTMLVGKGFQAVYIVLSAAIIAVLIGATYLFYNRRDLHI